MLSPEAVKGIYCDTYNLYVKYHVQEDSPQVWQAFNAEYGELLEKYGASRLCMRHLVGVLEQLEEEKGYVYAGGSV